MRSMVITAPPFASPEFTPSSIPALPVFAMAVAVIDRPRVGWERSLASGFVLICHLVKNLLLIIANTVILSLFSIQLQKINARGGKERLPLVHERRLCMYSISLSALPITKFFQSKVEV